MGIVLLILTSLPKFIFNILVVYFIDKLEIKDIIIFLLVAGVINHLLERSLELIIYRKKLDQTNLYIYAVSLVSAYLIAKALFLENISFVALGVLVLVNLIFYKLINMFTDKYKVE
ncbi:MAG: hypothetical protein Q3988_03085 [Gemella sp.]|nr:hypothetical protein [Gemella sp.]